MQSAVDSETSSSVDEQVGVAAVADKRGKHRILADVKRLEQDSKFLEEELEELEKAYNVSTICDELLQIIEMRADPLLELTNGPTNPSWDRWFERPRESQGCRCVIL